MKVKYIIGGTLKIYGSSLKVSLLNQIIQNTKIKNPVNEIRDGNIIYYLDKDISIRTVRVYQSPQIKHCIISHSSTLMSTDELKQSLTDALDDLKMFFFSPKSTSRYKDAVKIQQKAEEKYSKLGYQISTVGYSLGAQIGSVVGKNTDEIIVYNRPILLHDLLTQGDKQDDKLYIISTKEDVTSILRPFDKTSNHPNNYIFESGKNKLNAHYNDNLEQLDQNMTFGDPTIGNYDNNNNNDRSNVIIGTGININKLSKDELKKLIKLYRKGNASMYPITKKRKSELKEILKELQSKNM